MNKNTVKTAIYMNFVLLFCLSIIVGSVAVFAWFSGQGYQGKTMAYKKQLYIGAANLEITNYYGIKLEMENLTTLWLQNHLVLLKQTCNLEVMFILKLKLKTIPKQTNQFPVYICKMCNIQFHLPHTYSLEKTNLLLQGNLTLKLKNLLKEKQI